MRRYAFAALLAVAVLTRAAYTVRIHHGRGADLDHWDSESYDRMAQRWLDTGTFSDAVGRPMTDREPFYPLLLAAAHAVFGRSFIVALTLNVLLGALACLLVWALALKLFGDETAALWALGLAAIYPEWIYYAAFAYRETLITALTLGWLWLWAAAEDAPSALSFAGMGLLFGLCCVTRSPMIPLGGVFLLLIARRYPPKLWLKTAGSFALCAVLINGVWIARNHRVTGRFVAGASMGGLVMYMSLLKDYDKPQEAIEEKLYHTDDPVMRRASQAANAAEADAIYYAACRRILKADPLRFWTAFARKAVKLWRFYPSPNRAYHHGFGLLKWIGLLSNVPLAALSLWGGVLAWRRRARVDLLLAVPVVMTLIFAAYWSTTRYRAPLMGTGFVLAGLACARFRERA